MKRVNFEINYRIWFVVRDKVRNQVLNDAWEYGIVRVRIPVNDQMNEMGVEIRMDEPR